MGGHPQHLGGDEVHPAVEMSQRLGQRMHRPAVFQVAEEPDIEAAERLLVLEDGVQVEEGLGGMLVGPVAAVDHRDLGTLGGGPRRPLERVADHHHIGVPLDHLGGVAHRFALGRRAHGRVGEAHDRAAQADHGALEAQAGPGAGLVEEGGQDLALQDGRRRCFKAPRVVQDEEDLFLAEIADGDHVCALELAEVLILIGRHGHPRLWLKVGSYHNRPPMAPDISARGRFLSGRPRPTAASARVGAPGGGTAARTPGPSPPSPG